MAKAKAKTPRTPASSNPAAKKTTARPDDLVVPLKKGEKLAGITLHNGKAHALILLPGTFTGKWKDADLWAKKQGGELPNRHDAIVLFDNLKAEVEDRWYWMSVVHPSRADCAFIQHFAYGYQSGDRKGYGYRARAVRRVAI